MMKGRIHSIETLGTVDGPGMRFVLFLQGCSMRCACCHNPDTWQEQGGNLMTVEEIWQFFERNRSYYHSGGITVTGGEALLQLDFVIELFSFFKAKGIHTCLDTSGVTFTPENPAPFEKLLKVTDLIILDIKEMDDEKHVWLTGHSNKNILAFATFVNDQQVPLWIRNVVVPTITDNPKDLVALGYFLGSLPMVKTIDCLPYHLLGTEKYKELGYSYRLEGIPAATKEESKKALQYVLYGVQQYRKTNLP